MSGNTLQVCRGWDLSLWAEDLESNDGDIMILADDFDCRSYNSSPVKKRPQQRLNRVRGALNRSCSVPDSNNPPCFLPPTHGDISEPVSNLTEIGAEAPLWGDRPYRLNRGKSCESYPHCGSEDNQMEKSEIFFCGEECEVQGNRTSQDSTCSTVSCQEVEQGSPIHHNIPNNHMTKSMLCLNEESQDEVRLCDSKFFIRLFYSIFLQIVLGSSVWCWDVWRVSQEKTLLMKRSVSLEK